MQVILDTPIRQIDNDDAIQSGIQCLECGHVNDGEDLTFRKTAVRALLQSSVAKPEEKLERYTLAQILQAGPKTMELDNDQIQNIKKDVGAAFGILIYGRVCEIIDPVKVKASLKAKD